MLNTNQSKKRNSWKYYVVIPALAAFVLLFQVEVIAKEKSQIVVDKESNIESVNVYKITKNSTDSELAEIKDNLQKKHDVKFEVSDVKRNGSNELTSIVVDVRKGKQTVKSVQTSDGKAIDEFGVLVIDYKNGDTKIGIKTVDNSQEKEPKIATSKKLKTKTETNASTTSNTNTKTNIVTNTATSTFVTTDNDGKSATKIVITSNDKDSKVVVSNGAKSKLVDQLIIVDGEEMPSSFDINSIKPANIESVSIFKGTEAIAKYGDKGTNGVIEIETKK